jgi:transcriptional regulator with XRE-family HTH domain
MFLTMPRQTAKPDPTLGRVLAAWREQSGRTQEDVAYNAGVTTGTLARIELAQTSPEWMTVRQIVKALEMSLGELGDAIDAAEGTSRKSRRT